MFGRRLGGRTRRTAGRCHNVDAVKINAGDAEAEQVVLRIDALFAVDREAARLGLTGPARGAFRQEQARTWLNEIQEKARSLGKVKQ